MFANQGATKEGVLGAFDGPEADEVGIILRQFDAGGRIVAEYAYEKIEHSDANVASWHGVNSASL